MSNLLIPPNSFRDRHSGAFARFEMNVFIVHAPDALPGWNAQSLWQAGFFQPCDVEFGHAGVSETAASGASKAGVGLRLQELGDNRLSLIDAAKMSERSGTVAARDIVGRNLDQDTAGQGHSLFEMACEEVRSRQTEHREIA